MAEKDITEVVDEIVESAEEDPVLDGLKKVADFTSKAAKKTDKSVADIKAEVDGKMTELKKKIDNQSEQMEKAAGDILDRIDVLYKRTSAFTRVSVEQDDIAAIKEALPERFQKNMNRYEGETYSGSKGLLSDPRGVASVHAWFQLSTKLQMRAYDRDREKNMAEFTKLNDRMEAINKTSLEGQTDAQGGYSVPNIVGNEVLKIIRDASDIYSRARQITMTSDTLSFPDEATAVTTYWSATDGTTLTQGEPVFGQKQLFARKLIGRATFSVELIDDSNVAIIPFLQSCFGEKMGGDLDSAAMEASYSLAGTPFTGVLNATSVGDCARTNGTNGVVLKYNTSASTQASLVQLYTKAGEGTAIRGGTFVCGPGVYAQIIGLVDSNGQPVVRLGTVEGQPNNTLFGRPIIVSNRMTVTTVGAGTNSVGNLYYGPMNALLFGTRQGFRWDVTDQVNWAKYQADARMVGRFGFVVGVPTAWAKQASIII